ncbi:hypothetical protein ACFY2Q_03985 [Micromonospora sp. NPDC000316]|uniref:hypothetical protein n=1 Tax=Micromonospora sp. NPDC000316 TaxID=3364216 RepID=UPI00368C3561
MEAALNGVDFYRDSRGYIEFRSDARLRYLGMWLVDDVHGVHDTCLDLLADLEDIAAGRKQRESWEGNAWAAELSATGVDLQNLWRDQLAAHYALAETQRHVREYWRLLAQSPQRGPAVARWEERNGRRHPYSGL